MPERYAYHMFLAQDYTTEAEIKQRFGQFTVLVTLPALTPAQFSNLRSWLPNTNILAAEVNAMRVMIPADGSEPPYAYGQEIKRTFPSASLWRNCCTGAYITDGGPQAVNYSLDDSTIAWWAERASGFLRLTQGIYSDDSPATIPLWLAVERTSLGLIDDDGDGFPTRVGELSDKYELGVVNLTARLRAAHPGILIANTGTPRVDGNLHGISLELSGIPVADAAAAFKAQLRVARRPKLCIAWCKTQEELDEWRAVQTADPGLREVLSGIESSFTDWR